MSDPAKSVRPKTGPVQLPLLQWHIDRYDRLRASTASRASVVLSAGAILSAGNAVVLSQVLGGGFDRFHRWWVVACAIAIMVSATLVVISIILAAGVLVTPRPSRTMFQDLGSLPPSLLFNGPETVQRFGSFDAFRAAVVGQSDADVVNAAQVELFICIRQHRHRYVRLRVAVRFLRYAAVAFLLVLTIGVATNIIGRL